MQTERAFVWRHQWVFKLCAIYVIFFTSRVPLSRLIEQFLTTGNFQPKKKMWVRRTFQVGRQAANKSVAFLLFSSSHLLQTETFQPPKLLQELQPRAEAKIQTAPADLPEGDGGVCGGDVPPVDHLGLPQPLVRLGQRDLAAIRP